MSILNICCIDHNIEKCRSIMTIYLFALLLGMIAGLRSLTALAMVSWAGNLGWHML